MPVAHRIEQSAHPPVWDEELRGLECALCRRPLLPTRRAVRRLDTARDHYACAPECSTYDDGTDVMNRILAALRAPGVAGHRPPPRQPMGRKEVTPVSDPINGHDVGEDEIVTLPDEDQDDSKDDGK
jgi:hypothetical protein